MSSSELGPIFVIDKNYLALCAAVTVFYQLIFFTITAVCHFGLCFNQFFTLFLEKLFFPKKDKVTDFAGGTNFVILAVLTFILHRSFEIRQIVMTALIILWGIRLAGFLFFRIILWGKDNRFDDKRDSVARLAAFWTIQAFWVFICSLPVIFVNSLQTNVKKPIGALDGVGWGVFAIGLIVEATADFQKLFFKNSKDEKKSAWCDVGLWKWTR
jgi:steroid 5-alpha reductase family enzyme